jgi:shikimate kinase
MPWGGKALQSTDRIGLALGGFMGTGKSTIGPLIAARLGLPFVDTDSLLTAADGAIPLQFERDGEAMFRARERAVIAALAAGPPAVVATGGGAWVDPENRRALADWGRTVVLTAPLDVIRARIGGDPSRPLAGRLEALYAERQGVYALADRVVPTHGRAPADIAEEICAWLTTTPSPSRSAGARTT